MLFIKAEGLRACACEIHVGVHFHRVDVLPDRAIITLMDDASSVFDASILTGPVANFPVAGSFNRRLERDISR